MKSLALILPLSIVLLACNQENKKDTDDFMTVGSSYKIFCGQPMPLNIKIEKITNEMVIGRFVYTRDEIGLTGIGEAVSGLSEGQPICIYKSHIGAVLKMQQNK